MRPGHLADSRPERRLLGNLDCEVDFAALSGRPSGPLPGRILKSLAAMATLLRAFAREGDHLWLPAPVAPEAMAEVPGLPRPILETGPFDRLEKMADNLPWGVTAAVARLPRCPQSQPSADTPVFDFPWHLPAASPEATATVNHRRFALDLAEELGCRLPTARPVASLAVLESHLKATKAERWVLKAPISAAGRWRLIHLGGPLDALTRRRADRLFARHGELIFEPWMERTCDLGCTAAMTPTGLQMVSLHRQLVDRMGRFQGIELTAGAKGLETSWLPKHEADDLERVLHGTAWALERVNYVGAFSVDAWRYRTGSGEAFNPLGEINGRLTFGWVARALVDRVRGPLKIQSDQRVRLFFGKSENRRTKEVVPLLHSIGPQAPAAWLEIKDPPRSQHAVVENHGSRC